MSTFVTVGSAEQPFARLLDEVERLAGMGKLPAPVLVQYGFTPFTSTHCEVVDFVSRPDFDRMLDQHELLITHGGMTVIQCIRAGKVPVVMPRMSRYGEVVDDHQLEFVLPLEEAGKLALVRDPADLEAAVARALVLQRERRDAPVSIPKLVSLVGDVLEKWAKEIRD